MPPERRWEIPCLQEQPPPKAVNGFAVRIRLTDRKVQLRSLQERCRQVDELAGLQCHLSGRSSVRGVPMTITGVYSLRRLFTISHLHAWLESQA